MGKSAGKGAAERLKPGYCLTSFSEGMRKALGKGPADGHRRAPLSEGIRKALGKGPTDGQKRWQGRCGAFEAKVLPNVAFCRQYKKSTQRPVECL